MLLMLLWLVAGGQEKGGSLLLLIGRGCNRSCKLQSNISIYAKQERTCPRTVVQCALSTRFLSRLSQHGQGISAKAENVIIAEMLVQSTCDDLFILIDTVASRILD